jgi:hypothetical protein
MDQRAAWEDCRRYVDACGGIQHADGSVNWRAAFGADPGVMSCPACGELYWHWGVVAKCADCGFVFPTDWWSQYSVGVNEAEYVATCKRNGIKASRPSHHKRMQHAYYRYGYEHPAEKPYEAKDRVDWVQVIGDWPVEADAT